MGEISVYLRHSIKKKFYHDTIRILKVLLKLSPASYAIFCTFSQRFKRAG